MKQFLTPLISLYNGAAGMLSETGKQSLKRGISALFAAAVVYIVWFFLNKVVPKENQDTLKYLATLLCVMIGLLTGAATAKDLIALKYGTKETAPSTVADKSSPENQEVQ